MTSRTRAHHTICPYCNEEVYLEELIGGKCPLCGGTLEDPEDDIEVDEDGIERSDLSWLICHYFLFKKLDELGANPLQIMQVIQKFDEEDIFGEDATATTSFEVEVPFRRLERIIPRRCTSCGKLFVKGGKKVIAGDAGRPGFTVAYHCPHCSQ
ncbi:MAG: hypothetical protein PHP59_00490 [Methanofollis sp.]|uniref:hypothetical protein n=1 Tax=Methanofollis sp. TaxID=2052835 RepID=UPI002632CC33|nr:hypothetical protein [Methanofollis sp.]MDD4253840.1 hypothetical protein [Methanofollis sp.]